MVHYGALSVETVVAVPALVLLTGAVLLRVVDRVRDVRRHEVAFDTVVPRLIPLLDHLHLVTENRDHARRADYLPFPAAVHRLITIPIGEHRTLAHPLLLSARFIHLHRLAVPVVHLGLRLLTTPFMDDFNVVVENVLTINAVIALGAPVSASASVLGCMPLQRREIVRDVTALLARAQFPFALRHPDSVFRLCRCHALADSTTYRRVGLL